MAGFADLVARAQPALAEVNADATEGRTWSWTFTDIIDDAGTPINLSTVTGTCALVDELGGTPILTLDFTGGVGEFTVSKAAASTAGLATDKKVRNCSWYCKLVSGATQVQAWGAIDSSFRIEPEA